MFCVRINNPYVIDMKPMSDFLKSQPKVLDKRSFLESSVINWFFEIFLLGVKLK